MDRVATATSGDLNREMLSVLVRSAKDNKRMKYNVVSEPNEDAVGLGADLYHALQTELRGTLPQGTEEKIPLGWLPSR